MPQNLIFDSNLKPKSGRLTLKGLNYPNAGEYDCWRRKTRPTPSIFVNEDRSKANLWRWKDGRGGGGAMRWSCDGTEWRWQRSRGWEEKEKKEKQERNQENRKQGKRWKQRERIVGVAEREEHGKILRGIMWCFVLILIFCNKLRCQLLSGWQ